MMCVDAKSTRATVQTLVVSGIVVSLSETALIFRRFGD